MDPAPNEPWFYSREGVQNGPVTLEELREKARAGELNPRHDLVWRQGMPDWKPAGEVEGLFERRAPEETAKPSGEPAATTKPATAPSHDPYLPPAEEEQLAYSHDQAWPGIRRRWYLFWLYLFPAVLGLVSGFLQAAGVAIDPALNIAIIWAVPAIAAIYATLQRLPNLGMSRWWFFGQLVPFLNLWLWYRLTACPAGYAYHKKLDGPGIALAILYWLLVVLWIAAMVLVIAVFAGAAGDPELQEMIRQILEGTYVPPTVPAE